MKNVTQRIPKAFSKVSLLPVKEVKLLVMLARNLKHKSATLLSPTKRPATICPLPIVNRCYKKRTTMSDDYKDQLIQTAKYQLAPIKEMVFQILVNKGVQII